MPPKTTNVPALIARLTAALDADDLAAVRMEVLRLHGDRGRTDEDERNNAIRALIAERLLDAAETLKLT